MLTKWSSCILSTALLAPLMLAGAGCVHERAEQDAWSDLSPESPSSQKPITADQVNAANARSQIIPALRAELSPSEQH